MKTLVRSLIAIALLGMLISGMIACAAEKYQPGEYKKTEEGAPAAAPAGASTVIQSDKLEITEHSLIIGEYGNPIVKGTAKNISSSTIASAELEVTFYDPFACRLSSSEGKIENLGPGETREFKVTYFGPTKNVESYKIEVGSITLAGE